MHLGIQMWWRRLAEDQTEHQDGKEREFKWLWTWNGCWCQTGWSEYFKRVWVFQKLLIYWDFHAQPFLGFKENGPKKRKYPVSGSCVDENCLNGSGCCWWCNGVGDIFLAHFVPLSTNWALFKLRQFWRKKGVQPGTSKVHLIKWLVSVYVYIQVHLRKFEYGEKVHFLVNYFYLPSLWRVSMIVFWTIAKSALYPIIVV